MYGSIDHGRYQTESVNQEVLGEPITLPFSGLVAKSRFIKAAMTERLSSWDQNILEKRDIPSEQLITLYETWGKGGFGIIITGNAMVNPVDLEGAGNPIIYKLFETPERIDAFTRQAEAAKRHGSLIIMQVCHAGRQVAESINPYPVSASDVQLEPRIGMTFGKPTPLTLEGIKEVIDQFAYAADFAHRTGYHGVELHGAHGYLLAQFLSSTTNKRTDEYGGSLENRARIVYHIVEEIRRRVPDPKFSIGIKINSVEFQNGGFQAEECKEVCAHLEKLGLDFIELSGGTYEELAFVHKRESTRKREALFLEFADVIRPALSKTKVIVTSGFRTAAAMVHAIENGSTDGIGLARPVCEEPELPNLLIADKVPSARKTLYDENEFGVTNLNQMFVCGTQMAQIGAGEQPFNTTKKEEVERYMKELGEFINKMIENGKNGIVEAGFPYSTRAAGSSPPVV